MNVFQKQNTGLNSKQLYLDADNCNALNGNQKITNPCQTQSEDIEEDPQAMAYLQHLLDDGCNEGDSGYDMEMPTWYNEQLFKQGQSYMSKYRFILQSGMLFGLLAGLAVPSMLNILICTRQSSTPATAYRRYSRTVLHTHSWYKYSASDKTSKFWTSLKSVRETHSRSSRACAKLAAGQITQKDLALTQFSFIGLLTLGAHRIQMYDEEFLEATSHMWRVLGYLLGIKDEYNICGRNWAESKPRLDIVMRKVYEPAQENSSKEYKEMAAALLHGLWYINSILTVGSSLYLSKRLCNVKGYEFYDFDYRPGTKPDPQQRSYFKDLNWWDRIVVVCALFVVTYLHKYNLVRWFLNFMLWVSEIQNYYLPCLAMLSFGTKWAYVRIFKDSSGANDLEYHLKEN